MSHKSAPSTPVSTIGIDLGKNSFHLVGLDQRGAIVLQLKCTEKPRETMSENIFQRLYDSEINFEVSCFWDAKFDVRRGDAVNGFLAQDNVPSWGTPLRSGCTTRHSNSIRAAPTPNKRSATHGGQPTMKSCVSVSGTPDMEPELGGRNRIMIYGPKTDGTYLIEFRTAEGESLAISIPGSEAAVIKHRALI